MPDLADAEHGAPRPGQESSCDDWGLDFAPLNAEQARQWRMRHPRDCLWCVLVTQLVGGGATALLVGLFSGQSAWAWSTAFGALAVIVPTVFFLRRARRPAAMATSVLLNLLMSELVKIVLTAMLLLLAPRVVPGLSWPAMLIGLVATLKAYWLGVMWTSVRSARRVERIAPDAAGAAGTELIYRVKDAHGC